MTRSRIVGPQYRRRFFGAVWTQVTRLFGWLVRPSTQRVPRRWLRCPICDAVLVGPHPAGAILHASIGLTIEPSRAELIAKCPEHGRRPYNDPNSPERAPRKPYD